jgi:hypothetical protein
LAVRDTRAQLLALVGRILEETMAEHNVQLFRVFDVVEVADRC